MKENTEKEDNEDKEKKEQAKSKDITSSTLELHSQEDKESNIKQKEGNITIDDLNEIIGVNIMEEENNKEKENEEDIQEKRERNLSHDEILDKEIERIKKKRLNNYLMEDNQFKSFDSEAEFDINNKKFLIKPKRCQLYKFVGNTLFVFLDRYENPLLIIGPHWGMYVCFCGIITILMSVLYFVFWDKLNLLMHILGHISFWTYFISYTHCSLFNPGYPKNDLGRKFGYPSGDYYLCNLCNFYIKKSKYAHHCLDCDICIENYDHHCPWTGHCIGKNNIYSFYIFLFSSCLIIVYIGIAGSLGLSKKL